MQREVIRNIKAYNKTRILLIRKYADKFLEIVKLKRKLVLDTSQSTLSVKSLPYQDKLKEKFATAWKYRHSVSKK